MTAGRPAILCLVGPTAVGKTALTERLAAEAPCEVLSLDSRQVYRGLRIGTAQPTPRELALCPHHLIDFLPVAQRYDAAAYRRDFATAYADVVGRGKVPVLVGGAGLYLHALAQGLLKLPASAASRLPDVRAGLDRLAPQEVRRRLAREDPASFARIPERDLYRSRRALEILALSGRTMGDLMAAQRPDPCLGLEFRIYILERPAAELDERIRSRTEAMLAAGLVEETRGALAAAGPAAPGLRTLGYREVIRSLQGELDPSGLPQAIALATRRYAKRQRTWFRKVEAAGRGHPQDPAFIQAILRTLREPS